LVSALQEHRDRMMSLARNGSPVALEELAQAVDDIGEHLLVADEELRVQHEHLLQSTNRLDLLVAAHEELFANAPVAYVQTDADGIIVRVNHAARRLLRLPPQPRRSHALVSMVENVYRPAVRTLINELRLEADLRETSRPPQPVEAHLVRSGGPSVPVLFTGRRSSDGGSGRPLLHWEIQERSLPAVSQPAAGATPRVGSTLRPGDVPAVRALADAAVDLAQQDSPSLALQHVVAHARSVPGCDEAGITLVRPRGHVDSPVTTGELAAACDQLQYDLGEGPCLQAVALQQTVRANQLASDPRWPNFGPKAAELGIGSMLAVPLAVFRGTTGALNLYASAEDAFDRDSELIAEAFASHAAIALAHAELEANLRVGLTTREEIGRAVGILMERHRVNATAAFDMLVYASQRAHRKLRDLAVWVNMTGEDPSLFIASDGRQARN
jgi:PAS domain-containing protein